MFAILKLIRVQNLLIIALLQYIIRWFVIYPVLSEIGFELQFSEFDFFLLVFSTICITAAGYAINDYFDRKADYINRPDSVVVGKHIHQRFAMILHIVLNIIGILLGIYVSYKINLIEIAVIYPIVTGLLWFYSTTYKNHFLTGNIIVALLASLVPLLVVIYEIPMLNQKYGAFIEPGSDFTVLFIITYIKFLQPIIKKCMVQQVC
ncbi:MAG: UbiA family prenyltransferase [Bacteroidia bacterium]|nr:UbiA family prenyltransferase [Bacteroidia bacterium]